VGGHFGPAHGRGDYDVTFLMDTSTGRALRVQGTGGYPPAIVFSGDGYVAAWLEAVDWRHPEGSAQVVTADLKASEPHPRRSTILLSEPWSPLALSPAGDRLATVAGDSVSVTDLSSGTLLAAARLDPAVGRWRVAFVNPDHVRLYGLTGPQRGAGSTGPLVIAELSVRDRCLTVTGRIDDVGLASLWTMRRDPRDDRLLVRTHDTDGATITLRDGRSGSLVASLAAGGQEVRRAAVFTSDGGVALTEVNGSTAELRMFDASGRGTDVVGLPPATAAAPGPESSTGHLLVALEREARGNAGAWETVTVDLHTRTVRLRGDDLRPVAICPWPPCDLGARVEPGTLSSRLFLTPGLGVVLLDPGSGRRRVLVRPSPALFF
jgi:hypothetical protein